MGTPLITGPDREKMKEILDRTGYQLEITVGQRKYGGPPPGWEGLATGPSGAGHEVYNWKPLQTCFKGLHWSYSARAFRRFSHPIIRTMRQNLGHAVNDGSRHLEKSWIRFSNIL